MRIYDDDDDFDDDFDDEETCVNCGEDIFECECDEDLDDEL
jgi:hypothetical protein